MREERIYRTEAIVIRHTSFGEADRILTLYTPERGKLRALAKGVRRPTSRKGGHLELFTHSQLLIARGRNLDIITQAQTIHSFRAIREDLERVGAAYYAGELVDRFFQEGSSDPRLFAHLLEYLEALGRTGRLEVALRAFEMRLLECAGYRPELRACVRCRGQLEEKVNFFSYSQGGVLCPACARAEPRAKALSPQALKVLRFLQDEELATCLRLRLGQELGGELEATLQGYAVHLLERELKSAAFLRHLRRQAQMVIT